MTKFTPKFGKTYENKGGGLFRCISEDCFNSPEYASFMNVKSGWTFQARHIYVYEDGKIEWDWSQNGRFEEVPA